MLDKSESTQKNRQFEPRMSQKVKIINAVGSLVIAGGFVFIIFFTTFYKLPIRKWEYFTLNYTFIIIGLYYLLQSLFAIINNHCYIPSLKKNADFLPKVAIQIIGYHEKPEIFISILTNIKNFTYPKFLIKRVVFCIDGYDD